MSRYLSAPPPWPLSADTFARLDACPNRDEHRPAPVGFNNAVDTHKWVQRRCVCDLWAIWEKRAPLTEPEDQ
jgi:hypothetical protein